MKSKSCELLKDEENKSIWDKIYNISNFKPSIDLNVKSFEFKEHFEIYDICDISKWNKKKDEIIRSIFANCMGNDEYIYALDWQHSGFRYNPKSNAPTFKEEFIKDTNYSNGGYNVYFPEFYPNGDYYFFVSKNCRWGYLGHPWQKKVWIFGQKLIEEFNKYVIELEFIKCTK